MSEGAGSVPEAKLARCLVGGRWVDAGRREPIAYPYDGRFIGQSALADGTMVADAVAAAATAWVEWRSTASHRRAEILRAVAEGVRQESESLAASITLQTGIAMRDARAEVRRTISTFAVSAEEAKRVTGEIVAMDAVEGGEGKLGFALRVPIGVIAAITPFNAPLNIAAHKIGPALAAGNTVVWKPHPRGTLVASALADSLVQAGVPSGVLNLVNGDADIGRAVTAAPSISMINFTGSGRAAESVLSSAGLKPTLLELGGNAPTIVHLDADLERAAALCSRAAFGLNGQSCISTQRIYVHRSVEAAFTKGLVREAESLRVGDPLDPTTDVGPLIDRDGADRVASWIREAASMGALIQCGGRQHDSFVYPTVISRATSDMKIVCEEVFGPVVSLIAYDDLDEAIAAANDTPWGLKAGIFTSSLDVALRALRELEYGTVNINGPSRARLDHEPSGGVKLSGWGREGPRYAIEEMTYLKMISFAPSG